MKYLEAKKKKKVYLYEIGFEKKAVLRFRRWRFIFNPILFSVGIKNIKMCRVNNNGLRTQILSTSLHMVNTWSKFRVVYSLSWPKTYKFFKPVFKLFFFCYTISNFEQIFSELESDSTDEINRENFPYYRILSS